MKAISASGYLKEITRLLEAIDAVDIEHFSQVIWEAHERGRFIFACGNGGSGANASHFIEDLAKGIEFPPGMPRVKALSLNDSMPTVTAYANDIGYDSIFAQQLINFISSGDVLLVFTGSGNSPNVLRAIETAKEHGAKTLALLGTGGGKAQQLADKSIVIESNNMQQIEDCHLVLAHAIYSLVRDRGEGKS